MKAWCLDQTETSNQGQKLERICLEVTLAKGGW